MAPAGAGEAGRAGSGGDPSVCAHRAHGRAPSCAGVRVCVRGRGVRRRGARSVACAVAMVFSQLACWSTSTCRSSCPCTWPRSSRRRRSRARRCSPRRTASLTAAVVCRGVQSWSLFARTRPASSALRQPTCGRSCVALGPPPVRAATDHQSRAGVRRVTAAPRAAVPALADGRVGGVLGRRHRPVPGRRATRDGRPSPEHLDLVLDEDLVRAPWFQYRSRRRDDGSLRMTVMSSKAGTP